MDKSKPLMNKITYKPITEALINGQVVQYDNADAEYDASLHAHFEYLGKGKVYSVNGVKQQFSNQYHFWKTKNN